ncbi:hypothetical protein ISS05_01990 [Candidatus Woesearchaeota archaeon]|nr:hypothetical protein [Candidatus Woesearchaeota archaeon]
MVNKKVVLVSAGISRKEHPQFERFMPMTAVGLHYIKAYLEKSGYDVRVVNQTNDGLSNLETASAIDKNNPDFVLFNQFFNTRKRIREEIIPNLNGNYVIGTGGHDATFHSQKLSLDELARQYSQFDFIWQGEAETDLSGFLKNFQKQKKPLIIKNLENRLENLDELPILKHDDSDYSGDVGFLSTSRGCFPQKFSCDFCTTGMFYQNGWKSRSVEHVIPELENLAQNGKKYIFVTDDNFLGFSQKGIKRGNQIIEYASQLGLKLTIMTTKEQILLADKVGYLSNWQGTVFRALLGIENGSRESAMKLGKCSARHDAKYSEHCQEAISALDNNGIALFGGYINFNPASTVDELQQSAIFLRDNGREAANFTNLCQGLRFYEGTRICQTYPEQAENYEVRDGEFFYKFHNPEVQRVYEHLAKIKKIEDGLMGKIDSLNYEITNLVYLNQIQDTELGRKYFEVAEKRNQLNANYFLGLCFQSKEGKRLISNQDKFLKKSEILGNEYQRVYQDIRRNVEHK